MDFKHHAKTIARLAFIGGAVVLCLNRCGPAMPMQYANSPYPNLPYSANSYGNNIPGGNLSLLNLNLGNSNQNH